MWKELHKNLLRCWKDGLLVKSPDWSPEDSGSVPSTLMAHKPSVTPIPGHLVLSSPPYCMHVVYNIHVG